MFKFFCMSIGTFYIRTQVFEKRNILCGLGEKDKKCPVMHTNLSFLYWTQKMFLFPKKLCVNIQCSNVHAKFLF
jgi:hypothetical protein